MKRFTLLFLSTLLVFSFATLVNAESTEEQVQVSWDLTGCWMEINYRGTSGSNKYLGNINNYYIGTEIDNEGSPHRLQARTNCKGYVVNVKATAFGLPTGHLDTPGLAIADFGIRRDDWTNYTYFSGLDLPIELENRSNAGTTNLDMYYRYVVDELDVPGNYTVWLLYTMATN